MWSRDGILTVLAESGVEFAGAFLIGVGPSLGLSTTPWKPSWLPAFWDRRLSLLLTRYPLAEFNNTYSTPLRSRSGRGLTTSSRCRHVQHHQRLLRGTFVEAPRFRISFDTMPRMYWGGYLGR